MTRAGVGLAFLLAGCGAEDGGAADDAGLRLEQAARAADALPPDPATLTGVWTRGGDRLCVGPPGAAAGEQRVGLVLDYGAGNGCTARGTLIRRGTRLIFDLGVCSAAGRLEGNRIILSPDLDQSCARLCRGNATLSALRVDRVSEAAAEAASFRTPGGETPCAG